MPKANVKYGVEFTRNLGNFQNVKPSFVVELLDVEFNDVEDLDTYKDELSKHVDAWLVAKVEELDEDLK